MSDLFETRRMSGLRALLITGVYLLINTQVAFAQPTPNIDGVWQADGYGWVIEIEGSERRAMHRTELACLPIPHGDGLRTLQTLHQVKLSPDAQSFTAYSTENVTRFSFQRLDAWPSECNIEGAVSPSPEIVFEALWQAFREHYAFFKERSIDWYSTYHAYRPRVTSRMDEDDLFNVLVDTLEPLNDRHVTLSRSGEEEYRGGTGPVFTSTRDEFLRGEIEGDLMQAYWRLLQPYKDITDQVYLGHGARYAANDLIVWGSAAEDIGYLRIDAMAGFAGNAAYDEQLATISAVMDEVMSDFSTKRGVIVDMRFNLGGNDGLTLHLAGRFADQSRPAFVKYAKASDGFTEPQPFSTEPTGDIQFAGPIALLISNATVSAGENMTLFMMQFPHVTLIGERTAGVHSDELLVPLPNGWQVTISNEVFEAPDGTVFEARGIPPEIAVPYFTSDVLVSRVDPVMTKAIAHLRDTFVEQER